MPVGKVQTVGQMLVQDTLPESIKLTGALNKKSIKLLFEHLAKEYPDKYSDILYKLTDIGRNVATDYGNEASVSLNDLRLPPEAQKYRNQIAQRVRQISQDPKLSGKAKNEKIVAELSTLKEDITSKLVDEASGNNNSFGLSVKHGFRGSPQQFVQLIFGDILNADHHGRPIPIPVLHSYAEGVSPVEYWSGVYGSRASYADVQFATADSGYLAKQMSLLANRVQVSGEDCGATDIGVVRKGDDPDILGSVLAKPIAGLPEGTVITKKNARLIKDKDVMIRSVLTCQQDHGVCQLCAGHREKGEFPLIGDFVGVDSARAITEPMTQLGLSSKHGGAKIKKEEEISGLPEIDRFFQIPERFVAGSVLAPVQGKVTDIKQASQGGQYVFVNDQELYIPPERSLVVKQGDIVEAGDMLSDGTPNPAEIARYKGIGAGRKYFADKLYDLYKKNNIETKRRNTDILASAFFNRVEITDPDGFMGHEPGDVLLYSVLQKHYVPRKEAKEDRPEMLKGQYLERPYLHYTIGTELTPSVLSDLRVNGIGRVIAHPEHPGFEPEISRLEAFSAKDPDWKTRLAGSGLKKIFMESAAKGAESPRDDTSVIPFLMNPSGNKLETLQNQVSQVKLRT